MPVAAKYASDTAAPVASDALRVSRDGRRAVLRARIDVQLRGNVRHHAAAAGLRIEDVNVIDDDDVILVSVDGGCDAVKDGVRPGVIDATAQQYPENMATEGMEAVKAIETVDGCLGRVVEAVQESGGACVITADHGNADHMLEPDGSPNTAHSMNPVPLVIPCHQVVRSDGTIGQRVKGRCHWPGRWPGRSACRATGRFFLPGSSRRKDSRRSGSCSRRTTTGGGGA